MYRAMRPVPKNPTRAGRAPSLRRSAASAANAAVRCGADDRALEAGERIAGRIVVEDHDPRGPRDSRGHVLGKARDPLQAVRPHVAAERGRERVDAGGRPIGEAHRVRVRADRVAIVVEPVRSLDQFDDLALAPLERGLDLARRRPRRMSEPRSSRNPARRRPSSCRGCAAIRAGELGIEGNERLTVDLAVRGHAAAPGASGASTGPCSWAATRLAGFEARRSRSPGARSRSRRAAWRPSPRCDHDRGLAHAGSPGERALDLADLDPEAADLHLAVAPAEELELAVRPPAPAVAASVQPLARRGGGRRRNAARVRSGSLM